MTLKSHPTFYKWFEDIDERMRLAPIVRTEKWQSVDASKPEMKTYELLHESAEIQIRHVWEKHFAEIIKPNLPWADDHFLERVGGKSLNPGVQWANWPHAKSADRFRDCQGKFSHTYMERHWPKYAGSETHEQWGIRFKYGDTQDVVNLLQREPNTRQAYLPIFFPEDTGCVHGTRIPCTIGYQFIQRDDVLHMAYTLRSCDLANHFRDDVYLALKLMMWVRDQVNSKWRLGNFLMHITSLHLFVNDYHEKYGAHSC